jgi:hypothetical protein
MPTFYTIIIKIVALVLVLLCTFYAGKRVNDNQWLAKVHELEQKVAIADEKSKTINTVVETKVVEKVKVVKQNVYVNKEIIKEVAGKQLDAKCSLPESTIMLVNSASQNEVARSPTSADGTTSTVKASAVLDTVVENYGICNETREKLISWQDWYKAQKKIFEDLNK